MINDDGKAIPLSYFASWQPSNAPLSVNHRGLSAASTVSFNLPTGSSLSEASDAINRAMTQLGVPSRCAAALPVRRRCSRHHELAGYFDSGGHCHGLYRAGRAVRKLRAPVDHSPRSAGVGALLALELFGAPFSLIALIGIMLLIGIVKKNAIMMVDFAWTPSATAT